MISTDGVRPSITITGPGTAAGTIAVSTGTAGIASGRRLDTTRTSTTRTAIADTGGTDTATGGTDTATGPSGQDTGQDTTGYAYTGDLDELPATASELPIAALLGLLAVAAILAVRFLRS
jgi:cobalamin biosynthesis Mg chelatase CobN